MNRREFVINGIKTLSALAIMPLNTLSFQNTNEMVFKEEMPPKAVKIEQQEIKPKWIKTMDNIPDMIPDPKTRTSAAGILARFGWQQYEKIIQNALKRSNDISFKQCKNCGKWYFADSNTNKCKECE